MKMRTWIALFALALTATTVQAEAVPEAAPCPGNADALGTARILPVNAAATPRVGRKHFPQTLALAPKEVVLTFDDGPASGTTGHVLDALKRECVRASFFLLGRNALSYPELARRAVSEGHTVAHHTFSHPLLDRMPVVAAAAEIDRGFAAVDAVLYGHSDRMPRTPFFRFPGFASSAALLDREANRDRGDASQLPSFAQERRLSHRACRSRKSLMGCVACRSGAVRVSCRSSHRPDSLHPTEAIKEPLNCLPLLFG